MKCLSNSLLIMLGWVEHIFYYHLYMNVHSAFVSIPYHVPSVGCVAELVGYWPYLARIFLL